MGSARELRWIVQDDDHNNGGWVAVGSGATQRNQGCRCCWNGQREGVVGAGARGRKRIASFFVLSGLGEEKTSKNVMAKNYWA